MNLVRLAETPSTQDAAKKLAAEGAPHGTVVVAARQTAGRGQFDRRWESPEGNLYFSLVLRKDLDHEALPELALSAAAAVAAALPGVATRIKPPNDVYVGDRKLAGVLTESSFTGPRLDWVVIGIGLNVAAAPDYAVCLKELTGRDWDLDALMEAIVCRLA